MLRFLSPEWLARLPAPAGGSPALGARVVRHVVTGPPGADRAAYEVVMAEGGAVVRQSAEEPADVTFSSDYETASAIAAGRLSTEAALAAGRLKVSGDLSVLTEMAASLLPADPLPAQLRAETEFAA